MTDLSQLLTAHPFPTALERIHRSFARQPDNQTCGAAAIRHGQLAGDLGQLKHARANGQIKAAMVERECFTVAPFAGHYESLIDCGQHVSRGDVVGLLHDFDHIDSPAWPAVAGVEGLVIAQAWAAPVQRGQHIVVTGRILD